MLHLRLVVPTNVTDDVLSLLEGDAAVTNVVLLPGAARSPAGDVILADVAREGANAVIDCLRGLDVDKTGSIAVENVDVALSQTAREAQRAAPGEGADAVVWEEVANRTHDDAPCLTAFIYDQPDALSWVVAFLAGVAGMLSLTSAKSGALVGVLISVTTVPAAANVALGLAYGDVPEARGHSSSSVSTWGRSWSRAA